MNFTNLEKGKCAAREVAQRVRVYDRLVEQGKMRKEAADREIAIMREIADEYRIRAASDAPQLTL